MNHQPQEKRPVKNCHVCDGVRVYYLFSAGEHRMVRCDDCGLVFVNPQPADDELSRIYHAHYFPEKISAAEKKTLASVRQAAAQLYLSKIQRYHGITTGRLLEVGCGDGDFLVEANAAGWQVTGVESSPSAGQRAQARLQNGELRGDEWPLAALPAEQFDLCVISSVLGDVRSPAGLLREIHRVLKPGGTLFIAMPAMDSLLARILRQKWMELKAEHLTYFDCKNLQTALFKSGFRDVIAQPGGKIINFDCVRIHFDRYPAPLMTGLLNFLAHLLPAKTRAHHFHTTASGMMAFAHKAELKPQPVLSVILPAFNEAKTFEALMESLLRKELPGLRMEIIVVESNSTDGTRQAALKYKNHPRVKIILKDRPRGKGHAVRTGLNAATGDYILIQDADLEYDLEDYDALLEELVAGRSAFVLGSRHGGRNVLKMRRFAGQFGLSLLLNFGHWFFTFLINILFWQRLRDPFTMFKVFRRDCLYGLEFKCNRFDFDYELLVKLIRKGFRPVELPVNYRSRSFKEGKKVWMFRDPLNWLAVLVWLRYVEIDPLKTVEKKRNIAQEKS